MIGGDITTGAQEQLRMFLLWNLTDVIKVVGLPIAGFKDSMDQNFKCVCGWTTGS
uniref:Uncharacterized protein n=1 Tax=Arion vulgaris TaxID=1028688 RepID=A0A0B7BB01_9EUPU